MEDRYGIDAISQAMGPLTTGREGVKVRLDHAFAEMGPLHAEHFKGDRDRELFGRIFSRAKDRNDRMTLTEEEASEVAGWILELYESLLSRDAEEQEWARSAD